MSAADSMLAGNPSATWMRMSGGGYGGGHGGGHGGGLVEGGAANSMLPGNPSAVWTEMKGGGANDFSATMKAISFRLDQYGITYPAEYDKNTFLENLYAVYTEASGVDTIRANVNFQTTLRAFHTALAGRYADRAFVPYPFQKMAGLVNPATACYINASLQMIASIPEIKDEIMNSQSLDPSAIQVTSYFNEFIQASNSGIPLFTKSHELCPAFNYSGGIQEDIPVFLGKTIFNLYSDTSYIFHYYEDTWLKCDRNTDYVRRPSRDPPQIFLHLGIDNTVNSIQTAINNFSKIEDGFDLTIDGADCSGSKYTKIVIPDENKYLLIQLKRYFISANGSPTKNQHQVDPTNIIDISNNKYILSGCILHSGLSTNSGHYIYYKYTEDPSNNRLLYEYNDNAVTEFPADTRSISKNGYVFVYRRLTEAGTGSGSPPGGPVVPPGGPVVPPGGSGSPVSTLVVPPGDSGSPPGDPVVPSPTSRPTSFAELRVPELTNEDRSYITSGMINHSELNNFLGGPILSLRNSPVASLTSSVSPLEAPTLRSASNADRASSRALDFSPVYTRPSRGGKKRTTQKRSTVMRKLKRTASKRKHN